MMVDRVSSDGRRSTLQAVVNAGALGNAVQCLAARRRSALEYVAFLQYRDVL